MPYAHLSDDFIDSLENLGLDRDTILVAIEGLSFTSRLLLDGRIDTRLSKVSSSPDPEAAAQRLVDAGVWERTDTGYLIVDYLKHHRTREQVEKSQAEARLKVERSRRHKAGDHSICIKGWYCPDGVVTSNRTGNRTSKETTATPLLSTPLRKEVEGERVKGSSDEPSALGRAGLASARKIPAHIFVDADFTGDCAVCNLPQANGMHQKVPDKVLTAAARMFKGDAYNIHLADTYECEGAQMYDVYGRIGGREIQTQFTDKSVRLTAIIMVLALDTAPTKVDSLLAGLRALPDVGTVEVDSDDEGINVYLYGGRDDLSDGLTAIVKAFGAVIYATNAARSSESATA